MVPPNTFCVLEVPTSYKTTLEKVDTLAGAGEEDMPGVSCEIPFVSLLLSHIIVILLML